MPIIGFNEKREIGKTYNDNLNDVNRVVHNITYVVIREATIEEWIEEYSDIEEWMIQEARRRVESGNSFLYEIFTD